MAKIDVNGDTAHPFYAWMKEEMNVKEIKWNFAVRMRRERISTRNSNHFLFCIINEMFMK